MEGETATADALDSAGLLERCGARGSSFGGVHRWARHGGTCGVRVQGLWFRVWNLGLGICGLEFMVHLDE